MAYCIPDAETKVIVDALPIGLKTILSQNQKTGEFRPSTCIKSIKSNRTYYIHKLKERV